MGNGSRMAAIRSAFAPSKLHGGGEGGFNEDRKLPGLAESGYQVI